MPLEGSHARNSPGALTSRNLVVCIDGTSNKFGQKNTNVVKLYKQIDLNTERDPNTEQHAYYSSGIGTHAENLPFLHRVEKIISDIFDMALAWNVEENVKDAYGWLAKRYQQGDNIYLFGFSRGAYQVRVLASLIHEVGLIRTPSEKQIEMAFGHYRSIHPHKPESREMAAEFKKTYCWPDVRIHFVGVWDTVSSVGLIKGDVFVSTSASVTNAKHFRHALALDERRVKFMPEYFREMNTLSKNMLRPNASSDIKECWFSGSHSDVGGVSRLGQPHHAGNVSLSWMQHEASDQDLKFKSSDPGWNVEDVRSGRKSSLKFGWILLEIMFPFRHQVSFSGAGKNKLKWHWFRPRRIIPGQLIHDSAWHGGMYRPFAILGHGISIPTVLVGSVNGTAVDKPSKILTPGRSATMDSEELQAWIHRYAGQNELGALLRSREGEATNRADWLNYIEQQADFDQFVAITAYTLTCSEDETEVARLATKANLCLQPIFESSDGEHPDLVRVLSLLKHLKENGTLRKIIVQGFVASALVRLLQSFFFAKNTNGDTLKLVAESICLLLEPEEAELRNTMISELISSGLDTLSNMLETNEPSLIVASLHVIVFLVGDQEAQHMGEVRSRLKKKVKKLAKKKSGLVGLTAVAAFEGLREEGDHIRNLKFSNIVAYIGSGVWLEVEGGGKESSLRNSDERPPLATHGSQIEEQIGVKIKSAISSLSSSKRTTATLTFLKLCRYKGARDQLLDKVIVEIFKAQLKRKGSSLLAAYTLKTCLQYEMWGSQELVKNVLDNEQLLAHSIITMLHENLFDGSVGLVEGFDIFSRLVEYGTLKQAIKADERTVPMLQKKLEGNEHDEVRTSLRCLDILEQPGDSANPSPDSTSLVKQLVAHSLKHLKHDPWKLQKKGVHILSALSQISAGQEAIRERVSEIVGILLPEHYWKDLEAPASSSDTTANSHRDVRIKPIPPSQMLGATYALYSLSRNKELCNEIRDSKLYATLKGRYYSGTLVAGPDTPAWHFRTPKKVDVLVMTARLIKTIDEGFLYDGFGSVPETIPMVLQHPVVLGVILNSVTRALKSLPGLAVQLIQGTTTAISRGANKLRRGTTRPAEDASEHPRAAHSIPSTHAEEHHDPGPSGHLDIQMTESPPTSPINDQPRVSQLVMPQNELENIDLSGGHSQLEGTGPPDQETGTDDRRSPLVIPSVPDDPDPLFPSNDDGEIMEVPREGVVTITMTPRPGLASSGPTGVTATRGPNPWPSSLEQPVQPVVHQVDEAAVIPHSQSPGLITLKDFTVCDLPAKKFLNLLSPRARIRIRIGSQTFVSPTVKIGNDSAGGTRSRTHWEWNFSRPTPSNDKRIDIMIERRFLLGYTCIRHISPTTIQSIREGRDDHLVALPLREGGRRGNT